MNRTFLTSLAATLTHDQIKKYLTSTGWKLDSEIKSVASIWHHPSDQDSELLLPCHGTVRDYKERIVDLLIEIANFEKKSPSSLLDSIENFSADLVKVRIIHSDVSSGKIPLDDGVLLHERARELMVAAALSTSSKRKHFVGPRPPNTNDYLNNLKLGQSAVGSYIINIISPVELTENDQATTDTTSFSRMVTHTLVSGLNALHMATKKYADTGKIEEFAGTVMQGASANMCEALLGLSGRNRQRAFSITIEPSSTQEMPLQNIPLQFYFEAENIPTLEKATQFFKDNYVAKNKSIAGQVKRLDRTPDASIGWVAVNCIVNGFEKNVRIELSAQEYTMAIHAHEQKQPVACNGDLHVSPRSARLLNPKDFRILKNNDLFQ